MPTVEDTAVAATQSVPAASNGAKAKKASKKAAKKAPAAKKAAKKAAGDVKYGHERDKDLPWSEKKVQVFKALRSPKLKEGAGKTADLVAVSNGKLTARDVRHYCYHAKAAGLVKIEEVAEGDGTGFYFSLTAKGKAIDPDKAFKDQQEARKAAKAPKGKKAKKADKAAA